MESVIIFLEKSIGQIFNMKTICTFCAVALASCLLLVSAEEKKKDEKADKKDVGTVIGIDLGTTYSW